ncbi:sensor histidine kinase [Aliamphritea spongicola]|uniref:sensor histidine kinase n=1 Tax=Aliamphritea spongicola TaxID=707589 RepID=UPI00196AB45E|nr:ATP-binding protein [Aliamphritea spongicola]MBN3562219.1 HAMP domain-containing protein [Aliamphritea spongicola]
MGRLFWKIFCWFSATVICLLVLLFSLRLLAPPGELKPSVHQLQKERLNAVAALLQHSGPGVTRQYLQQNHRALPRLWVLNTQQEDLLGRSVPDFILQLPADRQLQQTVTTPDGQRYTLRMFKPGKAGKAVPSLLPPLPPAEGRPPRYFRWLVFIAVGLLASAWLAWYLTRPVRVLSQATRALSRGEPLQQIRPKLGRRKDELVSLADDFDHMAGALQHKQETLDQLLKDISHELRSPLTRVRLALGLLEKQQRPIGEADSEQISHELNRLDDLIDQVLTLTQLDSRQTPALNDYLSIPDLLAQLVDKLSLEARAKNSQLALQCDDKEAVIPANHELLWRALENVIRNAIAHTPEDTQVIIRAVTESAANTFRITVTDMGAGVEESRLEDIFNPFVRLDNARRRGGYGLGLAIAQRAIQQHHGSISARNIAGAGLQIDIQLPLAG